MRGFVFFVLLIAVVTANEFCDDHCNREIVSLPDGQSVCVLNPELGCFSTYESCKAWREEKCKNNLNHPIMIMGYCELQNFKCPDQKDNGKL